MIYSNSDMNEQLEHLSKKFEEDFSSKPNKYFSCGGRFEILGNHTDHNHGLCLAATCNLAITAAVKENDKGIVTFISAGYPVDIVNLEVLSPIESEKGTSRALIRGVAAYLVEHGYKVGGFDAYCVSEVPSGGGVSSSAAFECLIAAIISAFYNDNKVTKMDIAKVAQEAERDFFGKPCGILDQIGCAYGGISIVDFFDDKNPVVNNTSFPFKKSTIEIPP